MKKILSGLFFLTLLFTGTLSAQTNLNWTFKDQFTKGFLKTSTLFNSTFSGFGSADQTNSFIAKLKANPNVASCEVVTKTATTCDLKLKMKTVHDKSFYLTFAHNAGVQFITINGKKKTIEELKRGKQ